MAPIDREEVARRFRYVAPNEERGRRHAIARLTVVNCAGILADLLPEGRDKSLVFTHLEDALMRANAAIAHGVPDEDVPTEPPGQVAPPG